MRVLTPPGYRRAGGAGYPVLYLNDGQDLEAVGLRSTLARMQRDGEIAPLIVVAIDMPKDRMAGYGLSDRGKRASVVAQTKYGPVGANAHAYSEWLAEKLVPHIDAGWNTRRETESRTLLGWSLGALNAFSVGWQYPEVFGKVGAFSPSFWLSSRHDDASAVHDSRIAHALSLEAAHADVSDTRWQGFWAINLVCAVVGSWFGNRLWNAASRRLPLTLSGQLIQHRRLDRPAECSRIAKANIVQHNDYDIRRA